MRSYLFFIAILLLIGACAPVEASAAGDAVEIAKFVNDLMKQEYWDGDWSVADKNGTPIIIWKDNCYGADECVPTISAWIDIIGFRNESIINNTRYVNGSARDFAIIRRDARYHLPGDMEFISFNSTLKVVDYNWDSGINTTEAVQRSVFVYEEWICFVIPGFGEFCYWQEYTDIFNVSYMADSPDTFTTRIPDVQVHIKSHNRTVAHVTYIYIPIENDSSMKDVVISRVSYNGSNISRYDQTGWVMENDRKTEHVEFVDGGTLPSWDNDDTQSVIDHCGRFVTVFAHPFNISLLNISLHTPYETRHITNYSVETVTTNAKINVPLLKVIALLIISFLVIITILKVVKCVL